MQFGVYRRQMSRSMDMSSLYNLYYKNLVPIIYNFCRWIIYDMYEIKSDDQSSCLLGANVFYKNKSQDLTWFYRTMDVPVRFVLDPVKASLHCKTC